MIKQQHMHAAIVSVEFLPCSFCQRAKYGNAVEWMSLDMLEDEDEDDDESFFFSLFMSFKFPRGKAGFGPENPFALSFL